jgi:hypothetical protein
MKDYLDFVRSKYHSRTEWFDLDVPWAKRDAMEITWIPSKSSRPWRTLMYYLLLLALASAVQSEPYAFCPNRSAREAEA